MMFTEGREKEIVWVICLNSAICILLTNLGITESNQGFKFGDR
jgi:hypothetical protein